jgi:hypothetical protein
MQRKDVKHCISRRLEPDVQVKRLKGHHLFTRSGEAETINPSEYECDMAQLSTIYDIVK